MRAYMSHAHDGLCFSRFASGVWCDREKLALPESYAITEAERILAETEANSHIHEHAFGVTCCVSLRAASPVFAALADALAAFVNVGGALMTRPCQACDGTGEGAGWDFHRGAPDDCGACQGSGRIADTGYTPASDAQADAETLRLFVVLVRGHVNVARALFAAQEYGGYARNAVRHNPDVPTVKIEARGAAQAAFRAVPGLR